MSDTTPEATPAAPEVPQTAPAGTAAPAPVTTPAPAAPVDHESRLAAVEAKIEQFEHLAQGFLEGPGRRIARAFGIDLPSL